MKYATITISDAETAEIYWITKKSMPVSDGLWKKQLDKVLASYVRGVERGLSLAFTCYVNEHVKPQEIEMTIPNFF